MATRLTAAACDAMTFWAIDGDPYLFRQAHHSPKTFTHHPTSLLFGQFGQLRDHSSDHIALQLRCQPQGNTPEHAGHIHWKGPQLYADQPHDVQGYGCQHAGHNAPQHQLSERIAGDQCTAEPEWRQPSFRTVIAPARIVTTIPVRIPKIWAVLPYPKRNGATISQMPASAASQ